MKWYQERRRLKYRIIESGKNKSERVKNGLTEGDRKKDRDLVVLSI